MFGTDDFSKFAKEVHGMGGSWSFIGFRHILKRPSERYFFKFCHGEGRVRSIECFLGFFVS